jgi:hypothetical protein
MVTFATKRVLAIVVSFGGAAPLDQAMKRMAELLRVYASASAISCSVVS